MKSTQIGKLNEGINRQRVKGGVSAKWLYDLVNGYVDQNGVAKGRPGTVKRFDLPPGTVGLVYHAGNLHTFTMETGLTAPPGVIINYLGPPTEDRDGNAVTATGIHRIHYAQPFLGFLYVVAEFDTTGGETVTRHYWLQAGNDWQANHDYFPESDTDNDLPVTPSGGSGFIFRASYAGPSINAWKPEFEYKKGDKVRATEAYRDLHPEASDFYYKVVDVVGDAAQSGDSEPDWSVGHAPEDEHGDGYGYTYEYYDDVTGKHSEPESGGDGGSGGSGGGGSTRPPTPRPPRKAF